MTKETSDGQAKFKNNEGSNFVHKEGKRGVSHPHKNNSMHIALRAPHR
jgi:hypothetical protein